MTLKLYLYYLLLITAFAIATNAQSSTFTYQGRLSDGATPANGTYEMQFSLFNTPTGPGQIGSTITNSSVMVTAGVFTVNLDFSPTPFAAGADRWLEIAVKKTADPGFTTLAPRQQMTSGPYSIRSSSAANADNVSGVVAVANGGTGSATQNFVDLTTNQTVGGNKTFTGTVSGNGSGLTNLNGGNITNNTVAASSLASDTFPVSQNLSRLGQRRWDLLEQRVNVGTSPLNVAFDGANIWVTNFGSNNVTKLRASDGACIGTCAFTVALPQGIVFDGANIWVTSSGNNVVKLRASDGAPQGTFPAGSNPIGLAFDGANIWVANNSGGNVTKLRASDGAPQGTFAVGTNPFAVEFDGANIWVVNTGSSNVTKLRASDGALQGTFAVGTSPQGLAFDGSSIWVANSNSFVTKLRASDGTCVAPCVFAIGPVAIGIAFDGVNMWVVSNSGNSISKLRASDGTVVGTFMAGGGPRGIAFDGASMWVVNSSGNNVLKLPVFP